MALPTTFGPLTAATGAELDNNFAAVGALTTIQCTATGTNSIVLTPVANQPVVNGYGLPNPLKFGFPAPASTSGAVTLEVGAFGFLPVYTQNGVQATSGTLISGNYYEVTYSTASLYNAGNGAWVLSAYQPATGVTAVSAAAVGGLKIVNNAGTPSTKIDVSWTSACLVSSVGAPAFVGSTTATLDLTTGTVTSAANGMDGESRPASGWVYIYGISTGSGGATLGSLTSPLSGLPTLPAGYSFAGYLGAMFCDGSSNLLRSQQRSCRSQYMLVAASNTPIAPVIASGIAGTYSATSPVLAAVSISNFVPPTAGSIAVLANTTWKSGGTSGVNVAPNTAWGGTNNGFQGSAGNNPFSPAFPSPVSVVQAIELTLEGSTIAWCSSAAGGAIACLGWTDYVSAAGG